MIEIMSKHVVYRLETEITICIEIIGDEYAKGLQRPQTDDRRPNHYPWPLSILFNLKRL